MHSGDYDFVSLSGGDPRLILQGEQNNSKEQKIFGVVALEKWEKRESFTGIA